MSLPELSRVVALAALIGCGMSSQEDTTTAAPQPVLPSQTVGRLAGDGGVGHDGQATYRIPLTIPSGRAGLEPALALTYASRRPNDLVGAGWSLEGLSMVHRCPKLIGKDGANVAVRFDSSDLYCVDGQRLRSTGGVYGAPETRYRTEPDTFGEWASEGGTAAGPNHFWVRARDGRYLIYGTTADSRVEGLAQAAGPDGAPVQLGARRVAWLLKEIRDRWNNTLTITYRHYPGTGNDLPYVVPERIQYTGVRFDPNGNRNVWFDYEDRPDPMVRYTGGMRERAGVRLKRIRMEAPRTVGGAPAPVRSYELDYMTSATTGRSLLAAVRECDAAGTCLPATRFTYGQPARNPAFAAVPQSDLHPEAYRLDAADFDRDGRADLLYDRAFGRTAVRHASRTVDGAYDPELQGPGSDQWGRAVLSDIDADGTSELLLAPAGGSTGDPSSTVQNVYRVTRSGFEAIGVHPLYSAAPLLADLDGDALADELYVEDGRWHYRDDPEGPGIDVHALAGSPAPAYEVFHATTADLDGDGDAELLLPRPHTGGGIPWRLDRFTPNTVQQTAIEHTRCNVFADINGDGLKDVVSLYQGLHVQINAGGGLFLPRQPAWSCPGGGTSCSAPAFAMCDSGDPLTYRSSAYDHGLRVADLDQDGREDVLMFSPVAGSYHALAMALVARGEHELEIMTLGIAYRTPFNMGATSIAILDANADGHFDVAQIGTRQVIVDGAPTEVRYLDVQLQQTTGADLLQRVDADSWGALHGFTYAPLLRSGAYADLGGSCAYPVQCRTASFPVVTTEQVSRGQFILDRLHHEYEQLRVNVLHEDALGFQRHRVIDEAAGEDRVETYFDFSRVLVNGRHRHPRAAVPAAIHRFSFLDEAGGQQRWHGRAMSVTAWETRPTASGRSYFTRPIQTRTRAWDAGAPLPPPMTPATIVSDVTTSSTLDDFGNETRREVERGAGFRDITQRVIRNEPGSWLLGLIDEERVTSEAPTGTVTREHHFTYDGATGALASATREPNSAGAERTAQWLHTTFLYTRGVLYQTTQTDAQGRSRTAATTFDPYELMVPIRTIDALGHESTFAWDPGLGVQTLATDPNGVWVATEHDGFGRPRQVQGMDGSSTSISYETLQADATTFYPLVVRTTTNTGASSATYHDQRGLAVRRDELASDGVVRTILTDYDPAGRLVRQTRPYAPGGPVHSTWVAYDGAGRPTYQFQFGANGVETSSTTYAGSITERRDPEGRLQREVRDLAGHVVTTSIFPGGSSGPDVVTSFVYGPFGNLTQVVDTAGNPVTTTYDRLGRPIAVDDEDTGLRTVEYDAFGGVVAETDALGVTTTYQYDALGRRVSRTAPDGVDQWTWDTAPGAGIGRLHTKARGNVSTTHAYDAIGRIASEAVQVQNKTYTFLQAYDGLGRPSRTTYPLPPDELVPFAVDTVYGPYGHVQGLRDARTGLPIWTRGALTGAGELAGELLGNGQQIAREYEPGTGRVKRIAATGGPSWAHDLRYTYDRSGNVTARTDAGQGRTESFSYDGADRLIGTAIAGVQGRTFSYDLLGNRQGELEHLPGCSASHGAGLAGPHAVTSIECPSGTASTLTYDLNGRLVGRTGADALTATWTSFHKVARLERSIGRVDFTYDADHRIVRKQAHAPGSPPFADLSGVWSDTVQLGLYEKRTSNQTGAVDHVYHVRLGGQTVAERILSCPTPSACSESWRYLHRDLLGSVERTTDAAGNLVEAQSYTAFGAPRNADWASASYTPPAVTRVGYTGHDDLVETALVDMTGRLYDPKLHTFLSPDPIVQAPHHGPAWNRYSYVLNNPLRYVDPTGHVALNTHFQPLLAHDLVSYAGSAGFGPAAADGNAAMAFGLGAYEGAWGSMLSQMAIMFGQGAMEAAGDNMVAQRGTLINGHTFRVLDGVHQIRYSWDKEFHTVSRERYLTAVNYNTELESYSAEQRARIALSVETAALATQASFGYWFSLASAALAGELLLWGTPALAPQVPLPPPMARFLPKSGNKIGQQIARLKNVLGKATNLASFLSYTQNLAKDAFVAGTFVRGTVVFSSSVYANSTIYRRGAEYLVVQGRTIISYVPRVEEGWGVALQYVNLGGRP